jgi:hypothetical protein
VEEFVLSSICPERIVLACRTAGHDGVHDRGATQEAPGFTGGFVMWLDAASIRGPFDFQSNALPTELPSRGVQLVSWSLGGTCPPDE